ncbi:NAD-binding protein [Phellopilus nigrolimitatus]|nr:NAD-binding protein [Phellopilus nigrolimitatus]
MSGYKNFAVAGAGNIGKFVIEALLDKKASGAVSSVSVLTRSSGGHEELVAKGAKLSAVDYASPASLAGALAGIDVLISTLGGPAIAQQADLARAAKTAGVQLFVPSEFGTPGVFAVKDAFTDTLAALGLPYAVFYNGVFTDFLFSPIFGFDFKNGKASIGGSGTAPISFTHRNDIGNFVAHVLTALPRAKIEGRIFRIEGERLSFNQVVADYSARTGKPLEVTHRPRAEFEAAVAKNPADIASFLILEFDAGKCIVGKPDELTNNDWPEWKPAKVVDTIVEIYGH